MTHWIEIDAKRGSRLVLVLGSAHLQCVLFASIEIGDEKVQVQLLGDCAGGPCRRDVVRNLLEGDRRVLTVVEFNPLDLFGFEVAEGFDLQTSEP